MAALQGETTKLDDVEAVQPTTKFTDQTNHLPQRQVITVSFRGNRNTESYTKSRYQVFLACASVDFVALIDQTTLAVALSTIGSDLKATTQVSWIASGYFMYVLIPHVVDLFLVVLVLLSRDTFHI